MTLKRIPFGHEKKIMQASVDRCASCGVGRGENHQYGCESEECPRCGRMIIGCHCNCLTSYESSHMIQALYSKFLSLDDAVKDMALSEPQKSSSYLEHAAVQYIFENVPEDVRDKLIEEFRKKFPLLIPHLEDDEGTPYYTAEQLSQTLNIPLEEVHEKIDAMLEAGQDISFFNRPDQKKIH